MPVFEVFYTFRSPLCKQICERQTPGNIRRKLVAQLNISTIDKVVQLCKQTFPEQSPIPLARIKHELQAIYDQLGISHKAKATDIQAMVQSQRIVDLFGWKKGEVPDHYPLRHCSH